MKIDNPNSYYHNLYQLRVDRAFILSVIVLCVVQLFLNFPGEVIGIFVLKFIFWFIIWTALLSVVIVSILTSWKWVIGEL